MGRPKRKEVRLNGDEEGRREEARQEKEVRESTRRAIECFFREGGDLSGDEEEASRQEGCPEEKEVTSYTYTSGYAGGGTPQRHLYSILHDCS